ncbi:hypothetical protein C0992_010917, partial [Termitomyces sp. T32_za158]
MPMMAKYVYKLVFDFDNSVNPGAYGSSRIKSYSDICLVPIEYTYALTQSGSYTSKMFNEFIATEAKKLVMSGKLQSDTS